jgi:hypothetical protein
MADESVSMGDAVTDSPLFDGRHWLPDRVFVRKHLNRPRESLRMWIAYGSEVRDLHSDNRRQSQSVRDSGRRLQIPDYKLYGTIKDSRASRSGPLANPKCGTGTTDFFSPI